MKLLFCFCKEALKNALPDDDQFLQAKYANKIGKLLLYDSVNECFVNNCGIKQDISGTTLFLRTDYRHYREMETSIAEQGAYAIETMEHRRKIQLWMQSYQPNRHIFPVTYEQILYNAFSSDLSLTMNRSTKIFIKSQVKEFSGVVQAKDLTTPFSSISKIISSMSRDGIVDYIISEYIDIAVDTFGKLEVRFFILNGKIKNASRYFHSLSHSIPRKFWITAQRIVDFLSGVKDFPQNYVMDLAEIIYNNKRYIDVVEFNPISTAMCYVQNSIFDEFDADILTLHKATGFGAEYCLDMIEHPSNYDLAPKQNKIYTYHVE